MGEPSLALQEALRDRLIGFDAVTGLVPADHIIDRSTRPELDREILIGDGQSVFGDRFSSFHDTAYADLHIWVKEDSLSVAKQIAGVVIDAIQSGPLAIDGYFVSGVAVTGSRYMRDPHGEYSHGIVSVRAIVKERAA
jgi:hypothetical protein